MQLSQNTVFITGGSSGIGLAFAEKLMSLQNTVIVCGRTQQKLDVVRQQYPQIHEMLAWLLWPDTAECGVRTNLHHVLANLRAALGDRDAGRG